MGILVERLKLPEHLLWLLFARVLDQATGLLSLGHLHWLYSQLAWRDLRLSRAVRRLDTLLEELVLTVS